MEYRKERVCVFLFPGDGLLGEGLQNVIMSLERYGEPGKPAFKRLSGMHVMAMCARVLRGTSTSMSM
jgi:hypothetical protein